MFPQDLKYTKTHEWVKVEGNIAKVGITSFAIEALTDLTYLQFNVEEGDRLSQGDTFGDVESVKTTSQLYLPVSGKIVAIHRELSDMLEDLMKDPYGMGWMLKIELSNPSECDSLLSAEAYQKLTESESH